MSTTKNAKRRGPFKVVRSGSVSVTIYRLAHKHAADGWVYAVCWYVGSQRRMRQFTDLSEATEEAKLKAEQLAAGKLDATTLTVDDATTLAELRRLAGNVPPVAALQEWKKARDLVGGDVLRACEQWAQRHGNQLKKITVAKAVEDFIAAKRADGVDVKASYLRSLPAFKTEFAESQLSALTKSAMQSWLTKTYVHPISRNTVRSRIVTLFRWARDEGYLPRDILTEVERTSQAREGAMQIGIISPETLRATFALMQEKAPHYIPALTVAALCGLRRAEVHGQDWKDIHLEREILRVSVAKKGTPAYRIVPLCASAIEWLLPHRRKEGPICANLAVDRIRDIGRTAKLILPDNCFRHSFVTYRVAATGDLPKTSIEAGNSVPMIHKHYKELAAKKEGQAWFEVAPSDSLGANPREKAAVSNA